MEQESNLVESLRQEVEQGRKELHEQNQKEIKDEYIEEQQETNTEDLQQDEDIGQDEQEDDTQYEEEAQELVSDELEEIKKEKGEHAGKKFAQMRKELKDKDNEVQALRERMARLEGMQEASKKEPEPKEEVEPEPDRDEDPDAWFEYQLKQKDKKIEEINSKFEKIEQANQVNNAEQIYKDLESKRAEKDPTYKEAKSYLVKTLSSEIKSQYPNASDAQVAQEVKRQEYELVSTLASKGFGEDFIFDVIKTQAEKKGFKATQKKDNTKLKRNMEKSLSLNDAPSAAEGSGLTDKQIMRMSNAELAQASNDPKKKKQINEVMMRAKLKARG